MTLECATMDNIPEEARKIVKDLMEKENVFKINLRSCELLLEMANIIDELRNEILEKDKNIN